jgi:monoamine oxidase
MKLFTITTATAGALAAAALGLAGAAAAAPTGGSSAADTIASLQAEGYNVQLNGSQTAPLSRCIVTDVHGLSGTDSAGQRINPTQFDTVYVDISCPPRNNS